MTYYVLGVYPDKNAMALQLEGYETKRLAERAVNWQLLALWPGTRWLICERTCPSEFTEIGTGMVYAASQSPYNAAAWEAFLNTWAIEGGDNGQAD